MWMSNTGFNEVRGDHLEAVEPECRWCFAIDMERVKVETITQYDFEDALLLHL
jgi:hypothetical protein